MLRSDGHMFSGDGKEFAAVGIMSICGEDLDDEGFRIYINKYVNFIFPFSAQQGKITFII